MAHLLYYCTVPLHEDSQPFTINVATPIYSTLNKRTEYLNDITLRIEDENFNLIPITG